MNKPALILARAALAAASSFAALAAQAHTGADTAHSHDFVSGFMHPLTGLDHLAAMVAVGVWSALALRRAWAAPLAFAALLLVGAIAGLQGLALGAVEPMIAASLLALGLLIARRQNMPLAAAATLAGAFAIFHGLAHGSELAGAPEAAPVLAGMLCATVLLHAAGLALGHAIRRLDARWTQAAGAGVALLGLGLLARLA
jgi:urease accessory protein